MKDFIRHELAPRIVVPLSITIALISAYSLIQSGMKAPIAALLVTIIGLITIAVLERVMPYRKKWGESHGDWFVDFLYMFVTQLTIPKLIKPFVASVLLAATAWASKSYGGTIWPNHWPLVIQVSMMLVIAEFGRYWVHRASHTFPLLWRFHAIHHSPKRLYFFNAGRFHPFEKVFFLLPDIIPFILMGTGIECLAMYTVFYSWFGLFQHSNVDVKGGFLNYIFSMTELHRWHHSKIIEESDHNFGNNLIIWDIVFGTFFWPKEREVEEIGLLNPDYPQDFIQQTLAPFHKEDISKLPTPKEVEEKEVLSTS